MASNYPIQDWVKDGDDFVGGATITGTAGEGMWKVADTSSAGTPTYTKDAAAHGGVFTMQFSSTNEIQNLCLYWDDKLHLDIDQLQHVEFMVKTVASLDTATTLTFGLCTGRNDNPDSTTNNAQFKLAGSNAIVCETDDGTNDNDDKATGLSLVATYRHFVIDFTGGKSNVKFYIDDQHVATTTTFDMSNATGQLQPFVQLQKTADTNEDSVSIDLIAWQARRR